MTIADAGLGIAFPPAAPRSGWRRRSAELSNRGNMLLAQARNVLGADLDIRDVDEESPARTAEVVSSLTLLCIERLREHAPGRAASAAICTLAGDLQQLALELYDHEMASRTRRIAACEAGLTRLRAITTSADLVDRACKELVRSCGFGRAVLGRLEDGCWMPWRFHFVDPAIEGDAHWFEAWLDTKIPLDDRMLEKQLLTERRPELIRDTADTRVHTIITVGNSTSYVVAPIMPAGNVVGFLHADHHPSRRRCDEADRDILWAFAEGFGHIYERTVLLERLRGQREQVRETLGVVESTMAELSDSEIELAATADERSSFTRAAVSVLTTMSGNVEQLTPRELAVLELMVAGAKNRAIAEELVITEGTVKSHVKHILRKLGAVNRSQAIAHYLGASADPSD
jgi:DNA-binding CsgD family transcriptional regulator